ncbi:hypothetical protein SKAU_G00258490 [Synaphobranchus kaupii]|uniref:Uncharacterized protein n=1 Tax=Synaphobranchus kaupii TaxID=118154 RepID=A0A9Q1IQH8_SYNKA|nr:hypothetical protein SKAU_G00258490 [Synaphobranchus kaupii]
MTVLWSWRGGAESELVGSVSSGLRPSCVGLLFQSCAACPLQSPGGDETSNMSSIPAEYRDLCWLWLWNWELAVGQSHRMPGVFPNMPLRSAPEFSGVSPNQWRTATASSQGLWPRSKRCSTQWCLGTFQSLLKFR